MTAFRWIDKLGENRKSFEDVAEELKLQWGYLLADGKAIFIKGKQYARLLAADVHTPDIPMAQLWRGENREGWESVFIPFRDRIHYFLKGLVIDGNLGLRPAAGRVFPGVPIRLCVQLCVRQADKFLSYDFRYKYKGSGKGAEEFLEMAHRSFM